MRILVGIMNLKSKMRDHLRPLFIVLALMTLQILASEDMPGYGSKYWSYQVEIGEIGGKLNRFKFESLKVESSHTLLDFGCGGGFLLQEFSVQRKICVELNPSAQEMARSFGIEVHASVGTVASASVDRIISNHALEHVTNPFETLQQLLRVLKPGGEIIVVVPCEQLSDPNFFYYRENDLHQHLYTWVPATLGNLGRKAGFEVVVAGSFMHRWPPDYKETYMDDNFFDRCVAFAKENGSIQVLFHGRKPSFQ